MYTVHVAMQAGFTVHVISTCTCMSTRHVTHTYMHACNILDVVIVYFLTAGMRLVAFSLLRGIMRETS